MGDPEPAEPEPPLAADPPTPASVPATSSRPIELAPAVPPRKRRAPLAWVAVLALVGVGIGWAVWPRSTGHDATPPRATEPTVAVAPVQPEAPTVAVAPVQPEPEAIPDDREPETGPPDLEPATTTDAEPVDPPDTLEPAPVVEPSPDPRPEQPTTQKADPKPVRKKTSEPRGPTQLTITLLLFADMDVEINGVSFSLGVRKSTAKTSVTSSKVRVRWRRPLGKWKSKTFPVEPGASYDVRVDDRKAVLKLLKKAP
jgi:hypothetical protein